MEMFHDIQSDFKAFDAEQLTSSGIRMLQGCIFELQLQLRIHLQSVIRSGVHCQEAV